MKKYITFTLLFFLSAFFLTACGRSGKPYSESGVYFDTVIQITLYDAEAEPLLKDCFSMAQEYEALLSPSVKDSDLWNINHANGKSVEISEETYNLLKQSVSYAELTGGRIDPTTLPLSKLWGFYTENISSEDISSGDNPPKDISSKDISSEDTPSGDISSKDTSPEDTPSKDISPEDISSEYPERIPPSAEAIENCLSVIDYKKLSLSDENGSYTAALPDANMQVDLGFIAKGYIADQMKEYLVSQGVKSGFINLGGNVLTIGEKPDGSEYTIGIKPLDQNGTPVTTVSVKDKSVVTSGIYERCFEYDGVSNHHILNALTGYPSDNELYGVTILSDSSMQGDALSTTCMLLGLEEGMTLIENTASCEAVFITKDMEIYKTSGISD